MAGDDDMQSHPGKIVTLPAARKGDPIADAVTEDFAARIFAERYRDELRYCHTDGLWRVWRGSHWAREETKLAFDWARGLCRELNLKRTPRIAAASFASAVERFAQADRAFAVTAEVFDADAWLLGTPAGTVDLRTGELRPAAPADYVSKITATGPACAGETPDRWLAFLAETTGEDERLMGYLQRAAGYALTGSVREHALFFVYGPGGNGKSVFLNTLAGVLGDYAIAAPADTFTAARGERHPTDLAMFAGARLVVSSETEEGRAWAEQRIKSITGGDPITARFMRQDFFTYRPQFKLIIVGNYRPVLANVDDAVRRRFQIIPFVRKPERPDTELEQKLRAEWPAILRWAIDGCLEWQASGLQPPSAVADATAAYFDDQDTIAHWLEEECIAGNERRASSAELFRSWAKYAERNGERPGSAKAFVDAMRRRGFEYVRKVNGRAIRGFAGVELRQADMAAPESGFGFPER